MKAIWTKFERAERRRELQLNMTKLARLIAVGIMLSAEQVTAADPFEDGQAAYDRGDYATALKLWRPLAEHGAVEAQYNLGVMYDNGQGVLKDYVSAMKWYRRAAALGDLQAQMILGWIFEIGHGVTADYGEALKWYRLAADHGDAQAQNNVGLMYAKGKGVQEDDNQAVRWFRLASEQGYPAAQSNLGAMYANGHGVTQDFVRAYMWSNLAALGSSGDDAKKWMQNRDSLGAVMTPAQIAQAEEMARTCQVSNFKNCN
jgi:uncharacterized protein